MTSRGVIRWTKALGPVGFVAILVTGLIMIMSGTVSADAVEASAYLVSVLLAWRAGRGQRGSASASASGGSRSALSGPVT
jgi:hypothetical protein